MIEAVFSIFLIVIDAIIAAITFLVEFIAGFFVAAGQTLTALDLFLILFVFLAEIAVWLLLSLYHLMKAIVKFQKPTLVQKPVFWRPKPKDKSGKK